MGIFDEITDWFHDLVDGGAKPTLADLGADPDQVVQGGPSVATSAGPFPNSSGSSVIDQVNQSMSTATEAYREGMQIAQEAPAMPGAGQQAQGIIDGVIQASPEQLAGMEHTVGGLVAGDEIRGEVAESEQSLADRNAAHGATLATDREEIHARAVVTGAQEAIDRANSVS